MRIHPLVNLAPVEIDAQPLSKQVPNRMESRDKRLSLERSVAEESSGLLAIRERNITSSAFCICLQVLETATSMVAYCLIGHMSDMFLCLAFKHEKLGL